MNREDGARQTLRLLSESLEALSLADRVLLSTAKGLGWIGSGVLTYARRDDNTMGEGTEGLRRSDLEADRPVGPAPLPNPDSCLTL